MSVSTVKERPILFSGEMVKAILAGRKTQTRRIVKPQPEMNERAKVTKAALIDPSNMDRLFDADIRLNMKDECPYGNVGDRLWVRETWAESCEPENHKDAKDGFTYRADWDRFDDAELRDFKWRPSIFMPRSASRITLEITEIRVQRLEEISESDAEAEGPARANAGDFGMEKWSSAFRNLWLTINGHGSFDSRWVWALSFKVIV